jgi:hypothetical protein
VLPLPVVPVWAHTAPAMPNKNNIVGNFFILNSKKIE